MRPKSLSFLPNPFYFLLILSVRSFPALNESTIDIKERTNEWTDEQTYDSLRCGLFLESEKGDEKLPQNAESADGQKIFNRIMGGQTVHEGTSPWTAAIFRQKADKGTVYICAGTLISKRHVITAAHCMFGGSANKLCFEEAFKSASGAKAEEMCRQPNGFLSVQQMRQQISVYLGSVCLSGHNDPPCESPKMQRKFRVKSAIESGFCKKKCASDDFIVLELDLDDELDSAVPASLANHICLPFMHSLPDDFYWRQTLDGTEQTKRVQMAGWGSAPDKQKSNQYGKAYSKLQMLEMPNIWRHEQCEQEKREAEEGDDGLGFSEDKLCTAEQRSRDACLGDSGGGLVGHFEDGKGRKRWFLLGVLSTGGDCLKLSRGSVTPLIQEFTNITFHKNSIQKFVSDAKNSKLNAREETTTTKDGKETKGEEIGKMWGDCQ